MFGVYFMISFCLMNLENPCAELKRLRPDLEYTVLEEPMFKMGLKLETGQIFIGEGNSMQNAKNHAALQCLQSRFNQNVQQKRPRRKKKTRDLDRIQDDFGNDGQNWDKMLESWVKLRGIKRKIEETCSEVAHESVPCNKKVKKSSQNRSKMMESWVKKQKTEEMSCEASNESAPLNNKKLEKPFSEIANLQFFRMKDTFM